MNLGEGAPPGEIARYIEAFQTALDIGARWGTVMAEEAAARSLVVELMDASRRGSFETSLAPLREAIDKNEWADDKTFYYAVARVVHAAESADSLLLVEIPDLLRTAASLSVPSLLGEAPRTEHLTYRNPLELAVVGGGFAILGLVQLLRVIRGWRARRRMEAAAANIAEDGARRAKIRTDVIEYLGQEILAGRLHVPSGQLGAMLTSQDLNAVSTLAGPEPTLELPPNVVKFFREEQANQHEDDRAEQPVGETA
ncbi:MAG: hypothetical protein ACRDP4_13515 [Nocardioidaceae bacterium]